MLRSRSRPGLINRTSGGVDSSVFSADYFGYDGSTYAWYVASTPNAAYDATGNKTWITYEAWGGLSRVCLVTVYNHATNSWDGTWQAGITPEVDDDHGVPAIVFDHQGYAHIFYGPHSNPMQHAVSASPRDPTSWVQRPNVGTTLTYPHPVMVGSTMYLVARREDGVDTKMPMVYYKTTALNAGVETWSSQVVISDFGTATRNYIGTTVVKDGKIHILNTQANYNEQYRRDIFYFVLDPATGDVSSYDGVTTVAAASLPIDLADAQADFRIYTHALDNAARTGSIPSLDFDDDDNPHVLLSDGIPSASPNTQNIVHTYWTGSAWSTPETIATNSNRYDAYGIRKKANGDMQAMYVSDSTTERGGDIYVKDYTGGVWGSATLVKTADAGYPLDYPSPVFNATETLPWIFLEKAPDSLDVNAGLQRMFAWGDAGFVRRTHTSEINLTSDTISESAAISDAVATISGENGARFTFSEVLDPDGKFSVSGNQLLVADTLDYATATSHSVKLRSTLRDRTFDKTFTINVTEAAGVSDFLLQEYLLDEGSGQVITDNSGNSLNGVNGVTSGAEANDFNWVTAGVENDTTLSLIASVDYNAQMNVSGHHIFVAVRQLTSNSGTRKIICRENATLGQRAYAFELSAGKLRYGNHNTGGSLISVSDPATTTIALNEWALLEAEVNGAVVTLRKNGTDLVSSTLGQALLTDRVAPFYIGARIGFSSAVADGIRGTIGYVAVYERPLDSSEAALARTRLRDYMALKGVTIP